MPLTEGPTRSNDRGLCRSFLSADAGDERRVGHYTAWIFGPIFRSLCFPKGVNEYVVAAVTLLLAWCHKSAVAWGVSLIIVSTINLQAHSVPIFYSPSIEDSELLPVITNTNTTTAVAEEVFILRVLATANHARPNVAQFASMGQRVASAPANTRLYPALPRTVLAGLDLAEVALRVTKIQNLLSAYKAEDLSGLALPVLSEAEVGAESSSLGVLPGYVGFTAADADKFSHSHLRVTSEMSKGKPASESPAFSGVSMASPIPRTIISQTVMEVN